MRAARLFNHSKRRRWAVAAAPIAIVAAVLIGTALPASAHTATVTGHTVCANGDHIVTWTIRNNQANDTMTITALNATIGTTDYPVTGVNTTVAGGGFTTGTTHVAGNVSGSIVLHTTERWSDNFGPIDTDSNPVELIGPCEENTSTSTSSSTSTSTTSSTIASETRMASTTTTTVAQSGSTVSTAPPTTLIAGATSTLPASAVSPESVGQAAVSPASAGNSSLPFTGSSAFGPVAGAASLALGGLALAFGARRKRRR